jgi:hypothetical protein
MKIKMMCACALVAALGASASATTVTLTQMLQSPANTLFEGDKAFDSFTYVGNGTMPSPSDILVTSFTDTSGNIGLRFEGDFNDPAGGPAADASIRYRARSLDANNVITGVRLSADIDADTGNDAFGSIIESFLSTTTDFLEVYNSSGGTVNNATRNFSEGVSSLTVQKDILLHGRETGTGASVDEISQVFLQSSVDNGNGDNGGGGGGGDGDNGNGDGDNGGGDGDNGGGGGEVPIPEPTSAMIVTLAAAGLAMARRRNK